MTIAWILPALAILSLSAQQPSTAQPGIVDHLVGSWEGEGELFGAPTRFAMTWTPELDGRFLGLRYEIHGTVQMQALAHYRVGDSDTLQGVWVDSRGEILQLAATATDSTLETLWHAPTERGRTVYRRIGSDSLEVQDFVRGETGWRLFGTARYSRQ